MFREKGVIYTLTNTALGVLKILSWNNLIKRFREYRVYYGLKKYYNNTFQYNTIGNTCNHNTSLVRPRIWICWLQGLECAPSLVKTCVESIYSFYQKNEIIILTYNNLSEYVEIPDYIQEKHEKGLISPAHFSDIIRVALLTQHGGVWIDATVLLTGEIPADIMQSDFFCYRNTQTAFSKIKASNWFIVSKPNNPILCCVRNMLFIYWKKENRAKNYFIFHFFFAITISKNAECRNIWINTPNYSNYKNHLLQEQLLKPFNQQTYEVICKETTVHKLTYKLPLDDNNVVKESFYEFLTLKQ